jgi:hypothetical protein
MGTNFYVRKRFSLRHNREGQHIGKRSAAGKYCWDCGTTLCVGGDEGVHRDAAFYDNCPKCGKPANMENGYHAAFVELGFQEPQDLQRPTGVSSASSFTWACHAVDVVGKDIVDEYGRIYSWDEFEEQVIAFCPIQFFDSIGVEFS